MIASIRGQLLLVDGEHAVIEVGGLGIEVLASSRTLGAVSGRRGEEVSLHTHLHVREDALQLFGFRSQRERTFFLWLIAVSGVGPKVALAVLSGYPVEELELAVARDDVRKFESIPGIGKKLAQRLVVELRDKVGELPPVGAGETGEGGGPAPTDSFMAARSALQNLGLSLREAEEALRGAPEGAPLEDLLKYALSRSKEGVMAVPGERIGDPNERADDRDLELSLRPRRFSDFVGQNAAKEQLEIFVQAAKNRGDTLDHVLIAGPPGLGKTTLAGIIAQELGVGMHTTSGPAMERKVDVAGLLTNLQEGDVLFVDEIHRLNAAVEEVLYPAMEDYEIDIMIGEGPAARSIRMQVQPFTLIGATTRTGLLTTPLRDRFGVWQRLEYYEVEELAQIVRRSAGILRVTIDDHSALEIAGRSRGTPRVANRLLRRVRDFAEVRHQGVIDCDICLAALQLFQVDAEGLDKLDRDILCTIAQKFDGGPVGLDTLAVALGEEADTVMDVYEPYLIQQGFLKRTPRGRMLTRSGFQHCGLTPPAAADTLFDEG